MCPFFDPNCILLHTQLEHAEIYNNLDNNIPTHTRTYTHIGPGPGVEACDAAWPGRARRGGCGQLLRRAAETPEHLAHAHTCASTRIKGRRDAGTLGTCACAQARTPPHRKPTPQKKGVCKLEDLVFRFFDPNRIFRQAQARTVLCTKVVPTSMSVPRRATKRPANISAVVLMHGWSRPVFYDVSCARRTCIPRHEVGREHTIIGPTWSIVMSIHVLRRSDLS